MQIQEISGKIILVGAGKMGLALAHGWLKAGLNAKNLILVDPKPQQSTIELAKEYGAFLAPKLPENIEPKILVLAVKPQIIEPVMASLKNQITKNTIIISIAAGIDFINLNKALGTDKIIRAMPNTPVAVGKGVVGAVAFSGVNENEREIANALLAASSKTFWFDNETDLNALTFVSGCGPAYVFLLVEAMAKAGVEQGLEPNQAKLLARQTIIGAAKLMEEDLSEASVLRQNVTSKGGVTEAALSVLMEEKGFDYLFSKAFKKAKKRNLELGQSKIGTI